MQDDFFKRLEPLYGTTGLSQIAQAKVILFGVGGVGSWCAEALVRSGIKNLTLVDPDQVVESNVNRQLPASKETLGEYKVEVLARRLSQLLPDLSIQPNTSRYTKDTSSSFDLKSYDIIIDAIDSLTDKVNLILTANQLAIPIFSSLGAAGRIDPSKIRHADIWESSGCPLGKNLRAILRKNNFAGNFQVVFSQETPRAGYAKSENKGEKPILGSVITVTASFGMTLASLVLNHLAFENH